MKLEIEIYLLIMFYNINKKMLSTLYQKTSKSKKKSGKIILQNENTVNVWQNPELFKLNYAGHLKMFNFTLKKNFEDGYF